MEFFKDENMIYENDHSQFLAKILSIKNYRDLFVDSIGSSFKFGDSPSIEFEKDADGNGRIDLIIFDEKNTLIIENKVNAVDQDKQLQRYFDWASNKNINFKIFYLSPLGSNPVPSSLGNLELSSIGIISYDEHIVSWLSKCIVIATNNHEKEVLEDYFNKWTTYLNITYKDQWDKKSVNMYDFFKHISETEIESLVYIDEPMNKSHMHYFRKGKFNLKFLFDDREVELIYDAKNEDNLYFRMNKDDYSGLNLKGQWEPSNGCYDYIICGIEEAINTSQHDFNVVEKIQMAFKK